MKKTKNTAPTTATTNMTSQGSILKREDYKAVKHMNREQLTDYLARVYRRGYEAGKKDASLGKDEKDGE